MRISKSVWACRFTLGLEVFNFCSTIKLKSNPPLLCLFGRCFLFSREEPWLFVNNSPSSLHQPSWAWRINIKADNEHLGLLRCLRSFQFSSSRSHISILGDPTPPGSEIYWSQVLRLSLTGLIWCQSTGMISQCLGQSPQSQLAGDLWGERVPDHCQWNWYHGSFEGEPKFWIFHLCFSLCCDLAFLLWWFYLPRRYSLHISQFKLIRILWQIFHFLGLRNYKKLHLFPTFAQLTRAKFKQNSTALWTKILSL